LIATRIAPGVYRTTGPCGRLYLVEDVTAGIVPGVRRCWRVAEAGKACGPPALVGYAASLVESLRMIQDLKILPAVA
jgi:hypothetical protein